MDIFHAGWICAQEGGAAPIFRKTFLTQNVVQAQIDVCCLGWFQLYINGHPATDALMEPPVSTFYQNTPERRLLYPLGDRFRSPRLYFCRYDITQLLREGNNLLSLHLGNGWYNQNLRDIEGNFGFGTPKVAFCATITDRLGNTQTVSSDAGVKVGQSHILQNNLFFGETHDLSRKQDFHSVGFDDSGFQPAAPAADPGLPLSLSTWPKERVIRTIVPKLLGVFQGRQLYDLGENISGRVVLDVPAGYLGELRIEHSEERKEDGSLSFDSAGGEEQIQTFRVLCDGRPHSNIHPCFSWQGFRYFTLEGPVENIRCQVIHSDIRQVSHFSCGNARINGILDMYIRTELSNLHGCVPSDCPHRERLGYTGDGQVTCQTAMHVFDARQLYRKWMQDIVDCQNGDNGHIQHTAPFFGGGGGPGGWGGAVVLVPWAYYEMYGDPSLLQTHRDAIVHYLSYMESRCTDGIVTDEEPHGWCLGDWCYTGCSGIVKAPIAEGYVNTAYLIRFYQLLLEVDRELGLELDTRTYQANLKVHCDALLREFYDPATGDFCQDNFGANAFAVDIGLGDSRTLENLVAKYTAFDGFDTGIFATETLIRVLTEQGYSNLVYQLLNSDKKNHSFGYMLEQGATTIWEHWNGGGSHSHPMFGGCVKALWTALLGIRPMKPGYARVLIQPCDIPGLGDMEGDLMTPHGSICVTLRRREGQIHLSVTLPEGVEGELSFRNQRKALTPGKKTLCIQE